MSQLMSEQNVTFQLQQVPFLGGVVEATLNLGGSGGGAVRCAKSAALADVVEPCDS